MSLLDPTETRRLKSSLALLASPVDGEVLAAAAAAKRILGKKGLGFTDLGVRPAITAPQHDASPFSHKSYANAASSIHQQHARRCLNSSLVDWKPHERRFLAQMAEWRRQPSEAQQAWLDGLVDRLARAAGEGSDVDF